MSAQSATRIVQISLDNIDDLMTVALESFFRATKVLKPSDVVDKIYLDYTPPWTGEYRDVVIKLIPVRRRVRKEVEHIVYNGA